MEGTGINIVLLNVSYAEGMADSARVRNLFEPLRHRGKVTLHNLVHSNTKQKSVSGEIDGVSYKKITYCWYNPVSIFLFYQQGIQFIHSAARKETENVLYHYDSPDIKNLLFILYARTQGYKIVFDIVEDNRYQVRFTGFLHWIRLMSSRILIHSTSYLAHSILAISQHLYQRMQSITAGRVPVYLMPISVDFNYFRRTDYIPDEKNIRIFYGGSFAAKDGIAGLINAFDKVSKKFSGVTLILSGIGLDADIKKYLEQIRSLENGNRIIYMGYLKTEAYYKLLNQCDIFCMTRINTKYANAGFPFKLGEFLAAGRAVIATKIGDVPQYLEHNVNALIIEPGSEDQLVAAITYILTNIPRIPVLGAEARKVAENNFDSTRTSARLLEILQAV
ncbi:MAG TPA: glycosyltransferase family 4 protein [Flavitalea sp.]|nr:glycosyltransferase family 4 protein [Flavitalea sp.]